MSTDRKTRYREIRRTIIIALAGTTTLAAAQAVVGLITGSYAVLATAVQLGLDLIIGVAILYASAIAERAPDVGHPYGHGKAESVASLLVGILLLYAAYEVLGGAVRALFRPEPEIPGAGAIAVAAAGVVLMEFLYRFQYASGQRLNSEPLMASARDLRADQLAIAASLAGVGLARLGYPRLDPAAAILVGIIILRTAWEVGYESISGLMDRPAPPEVERKIRDVAESVPGVLEAFEIRTRYSGPFIMSDLGVHVNETLTIKQGHEIAVEVRRRVLEQVDSVVDVLVHIHVGRHEIEPHGHHLAA